MSKESLIFIIIGLIDFPIQLIIRSTFERKVTSKNNIKENPKCPNISLLTLILYFLYDLRCHITWRSAKQLNLPFHTSTKPKNQLFLVQDLQTILCFRVLCHDVKLISNVSMPNLRPKNAGWICLHLDRILIGAVILSSRKAKYQANTTLLCLRGCSFRLRQRSERYWGGLAFVKFGSPFVVIFSFVFI